jgi:RAMA domain-containing protein
MFIERYGLKQHLRPLRSNTDLRAAATIRGELYRRLCAAIWDRQALGFPPPPSEPETDIRESSSPEAAAPQNPPAPAPRKSAGRPTDIQMMIRKGVLTPGTPLVGNDTTAHIQPDGQLRLATGDVFRKPDDAARAVTGKRTKACCSGMSHPQTAPASRSGSPAIKPSRSSQQHRGPRGSRGGNHPPPGPPCQMVTQTAVPGAVPDGD